MLDVSIFLGLDGTPTRKVGIEWSGAPEQIGNAKLKKKECFCTDTLCYDYPQAIHTHM